MARKIRYYYDEESCTFQQERITARSVIRYSLSLFSLAALLACTGLAIYFFAYDDPKNALLRSQNEALKVQLDALHTQFASLEGQVDELHSRDNEFYRSLMNADRIPEGIWNGGRGGAVNLQQSNEPEVLANTHDKMETVKYKTDLQSKSYDVLFDELSNKEDELRHTPAIRPVKGRIISGFGMRMHPILKQPKRHTGLDMQADRGTPIYAAADGVVKFAGKSRGGYGVQVHLVHGEFGYESKYAHLKAVKVRKGQKVKRGDIIGLSGNTGLSKGPHLHYEIVKNGTKINPIDYFYGELSPEEYVMARKEAKVENESMD